MSNTYTVIPGDAPSKRETWGEWGSEVGAEAAAEWKAAHGEKREWTEYDEAVANVWAATHPGEKRETWSEYGEGVADAWKAAHGEKRETWGEWGAEIGEEASAEWKAAHGL